MITRSLNDLARRRPESIYGAIYSLPELREVFLSVVDEKAADSWSHKPPAEFENQIDGEKKKELLEKAGDFLRGLDDESRGRTMHALNSWCEADGLFRFAMSKCSSNEKKYESIYRTRATRGVFDALDEGRRKQPELLGEKLSAAERSAYYLQALNAIAQLSERGQLAYFHEVFGYWSEKLAPKG
ncbi:MAG: hypothetical protein ABIK65_15585 [Candidatus Eisenbacteria bacterium]